MQLILQQPDLLVPCHCVENIMVDRFQKAAIGKQIVVKHLLPAALFPGLFDFVLWFVFSIIHRSVKNRGGLGSRLYYYHIVHT